MPNDLKTQARRLRDWATDHALPFWADTGRDAEGGFYEDLDLSGAPRTDIVRRFRVQARQIYVYALATHLNWYNGKEIVSTGYDFLLDKGFEVDERPGFIHLLNADYSVKDGRRDLYDHAFYLLASAWTLKVIDHPRAPETRDNVMGFINTRLRSDFGGWLEGIPTSLPRRQNPHMHMFETCLNSYSLTGETQWKDRAADIFDLFRRHFYDADTATIIEFFENDWTPMAGQPGRSREPGHAAEWIWLVGWYERLCGIDTSTYANALYQKLLAQSDPFLNDEETPSGELLRGTKRLWCQTELIKAHLAQAERGIAGAADMAAAAMTGFEHVYLKPDGTWHDQIDENGEASAKTIPASTFYHIMCMISEACRVAEALD